MGVPLGTPHVATFVVLSVAEAEEVMLIRQLEVVDHQLCHRAHHQPSIHLEMVHQCRQLVVHPNLCHPGMGLDQVSFHNFHDLH